MRHVTQSETCLFCFFEVKHVTQGALLSRYFLPWWVLAGAYGMSSIQHLVFSCLLWFKSAFILLWSSDLESSFASTWSCYFWRQMPILVALQQHVGWPQPRDGVHWSFLQFWQAFLELRLQLFLGLVLDWQSSNTCRSTTSEYQNSTICCACF